MALHGTKQGLFIRSYPEIEIWLKIMRRNNRRGQRKGVRVTKRHKLNRCRCGKKTGPCARWKDVHHDRIQQRRQLKRLINESLRRRAGTEPPFLNRDG